MIQLRNEREQELVKELLRNIGAAMRESEIRGYELPEAIDHVDDCLISNGVDPEPYLQGYREAVEDPIEETGEAA